MRFLIYALLTFLLFPFVSCNKEDDIIQNDTQVGISKIVYFPTIAIKGERFIILKQGDTYKDAGATALLNGQPTAFTVATVNTATPGVYELTYLAANPQGYTASDWRTVIVIGNDVTANNFSGTYQRAATGVSSKWTKTANGIYEVDNPGGAATGVGYKVVVVNFQGNKIKIPKQIASDPTGAPGIVSSTTETYNAAATPISYSWIFLAAGYGTGSRTFAKQ
ncbi:MAG: immunoglobulin-like domain-containing protein [Chitinophagaceae bacterium]